MGPVEVEAVAVAVQANASRRWLNLLAALLLAPPLAVALWVAGMYAWFQATYVCEDVTAGTAYGFDIGDSKRSALASARLLLEEHPDALLHVVTGQRAGDHFDVPLSNEALPRLSPHDEWGVLLDGPGQFWNTVTLTFEDGALVKIHRHRQAFELP